MLSGEGWEVRVLAMQAQDTAQVQNLQSYLVGLVAYLLLRSASNGGSLSKMASEASWISELGLIEKSCLKRVR